MTSLASEHRYTIEKTRKGQGLGYGDLRSLGVRAVDASAVTTGANVTMTRPEAMAFCSETYGLWTGERIRAYLRDCGVVVSLRTVQRWGNPTGAEVACDRDRDRRAQRRRSHRVYERMVELDAAGMPLSSIAIVLTVDLAIPVSRDQVRYSLDVGRLAGGLHKSVNS